MPDTATALVFAASLAALATPPAGADELPQRRSGLWEIKTQAVPSNTPPHTVQLCVDRKTDDAMELVASGPTKDLCTTKDRHREGGRLFIEAVCKIGETTATTRSAFTGDFDSAYRVETTSTYEPALAGIKGGSAVIEAKWLGPCKAEQKPGDMILGNGMKININNATGKPGN